MTHELKNIFEEVLINQKEGHKSVLATVVSLNGSSYRKPGVRMLISESGKITGAVSGGCVEKAICDEAHTVFKNGNAKMMTYDGRYRLGCEGILYILLEPIIISEELETAFFNQITGRKPFEIISNFSEDVGENEGLMSVLDFGNKRLFSINSEYSEEKISVSLEKFQQHMVPISKLILIGAEHDAVSLCAAAALLGWEVSIVTSPKDPKTAQNFPGCKEVFALDPEQIASLKMDKQTAVVLMTHNYARDLNFLLSIKDNDAFYIGLLGSTVRRENIFNDLIEKQADINFDFFDRFYGPAGIDIGAITPEEISISILSEILAVKQGKKIPSLRDSLGNFH